MFNELGEIRSPNHRITFPCRCLPNAGSDRFSSFFLVFLALFGTWWPPLPLEFILVTHKHLFRSTIFTFFRFGPKKVVQPRKNGRSTESVRWQWRYGRCCGSNSSGNHVPGSTSLCVQINTFFSVSPHLFRQPDGVIFASLVIRIRSQSASSHPPVRLETFWRICLSTNKVPGTWTRQNVCLWGQFFGPGLRDGLTWRSFAVCALFFELNSFLGQKTDRPPSEQLKSPFILRLKADLPLEEEKNVWDLCK